MNLEIKRVFSPDFDSYPEDSHKFNVSLCVDIGEKGKEGAETFHFVAASPQGLENEVRGGNPNSCADISFMAEFDWKVIHRPIENIINHARSRENWDEVIRYFNRYGIYDSEDLDGGFYP